MDLSSFESMKQFDTILSAERMGAIHASHKQSASGDKPKILILRASIAGLTLAHWLRQHGFDLVVVVLSAGPRTSGAPIDFRVRRWR
jgi:hypothetical protein